MMTRAIPAQITTVEDRIAGNLNLTQIVLLMIPIFCLMVVYAILPKVMQLSLYKIPFVVLVTIICLTLALRIKGKVVLHWLVVLFKYNVRPRYYIYDKNESYLRDIVLPVLKVRQSKASAKVVEVEKSKVKMPFIDLVHLDQLVSDPALSFSFKPRREGGLNVAIEQKQK